MLKIVSYLWISHNIPDIDLEKYGISLTYSLPKEVFLEDKTFVLMDRFRILLHTSFFTPQTLRMIALDVLVPYISDEDYIKYVPLLVRGTEADRNAIRGRFRTSHPLWSLCITDLNVLAWASVIWVMSTSNFDVSEKQRIFSIVKKYIS